MAISFNLYYFSRQTGEYMQEAVDSVPQGVIAHAVLLSASLPEPASNEADVYFVEYHQQLPGLDEWLDNIKHTETARVFLYLREADTDALLKALRLGVQECFVATITAEDFQKAVKRLLKAKTALQPGEKTQIVALLGCKGGVGVTFATVNLAQSLAASHHSPVLVVDLDLRAGNVSAFLDIQPRYTIVDVVENFDRLDPQYLNDIIHHTDSGLDVLPAPTRLEDSELVDAAHLEKVLHYIKSQNLYRWIVLDLGDVLDELMLKALELSDLVLLITLLTIPGLKDTRKIMEMFQILEFPDDKIQLVVNCSRKETNIKEAEAKKFLSQDFLAILRFDHDTVVRSINEGQPLVKVEPRHRLSLDFASLAEKLCPKGEDNGQRSWGLAGLKRLLHLRK